MYEKFYGLKENPFSLTPDPEFIFLNKNYQAAFDQVLYAIRRREGFTVITGDVGTGKTTLCWALLGRLADELQTALVLNPMLSAEDMLRAILQDFGIKRRHIHSSDGPPPEPAPEGSGWMQGLSRKELIDELNYFLLRRAEEDAFCILIIDEAQDLSLDVLEQLRLLSNLETSKKKLLQIIFVGQIEFTQKLKSNELRSLNQRISIRYELKPLSPEETVLYIAHRLRIAKASPNLDFTRGALNEVYKYSRGCPRLVNLVCDRALLAGYAERAWTITGRMVRDAVRRLRGKESAQPEPPKWKRLVPALAAVLILVISLVIFSAMRNMAPVVSRRPAPAPSRVVESATEPVTPTSPDASPAPVKDPAPSPVLSPAARETSGSATQARAEIAADSADSYSVQVHSLREKTKADEAVRELETLGFKAYTRVQTQGANKRWYAVMAGPFGLQDAQKCVSALRSRRYLRLIIVHSAE